MRLTPKTPPRTFQAGRRTTILLRDCGTVELEADEQVTFVTEAGAEYDVARKEWGFYATPSVNGRLAGFGLRAALVRNPQGRCYVLLVERGRERSFEAYLRDEEIRVVAWLDDEATLDAIDQAGGPRDA